MSATKEYLEWRTGAPIGCVFARYMSRSPSKFGQIVEEVSVAGGATQMAATIARRTSELIAEPNALAAAFLLPDLQNLRVLAETALALKACPGWSVETSLLAPPPAIDLVAFRIVRDLPFKDRSMPSEALVLGPFDEFPATRRAPVAAFEIFVGEPMEQDPKNHQPSTKANFAHIDLLNGDLISVDINKSLVDSMWENSKTGRLRSLGGVEDNRAKAKVSFVIPSALARDLGCAP